MESVFPVVLEPGQQAQIILRIQSRGWRTITVDSWLPSNYVHALQQTRVMHSTIGGIALTSIFLLLLTRQRLFVLLAIWLAIAVTSSSFNLGYGIQTLSTWLPGNALSALVATLATWDYTLLILATGVILGLYKRTLWRRLLYCVLASGVACSVLFFFIDTLWLRWIIAVSLTALLAIWPPMVWAARHHAWHHHRVIVVLLGLEWTSQLTRMVAYNTTWLIDYDRTVYQANIYGQVIVLLFIIGQATRDQQRLLRRLQQREKSLERDQREQLEALVTERTIQLEHSTLVAKKATEDKTEFLSHVSHDLRSPLATIIGYTRLLQTKIDAAGSRKQLETIGRTANHMLNVIDDLVEYTRDSGVQDITPKPMYTTWFEDVIARQAKTLAETNGNEFALLIKDPLPTVIVADSKRVLRVLMNLLDNAAKFTHNGRIELHIQCKPTPDPNQVTMRFIVRDTGCGIHPDDQTRLFQPFYRGRGSHGSSGLGLGMRIVSTWVERMHGTLLVRSGPDQGTEITVELTFPVGEERDVQRSPHMDVSHPRLKGEGRKTDNTRHRPHSRSTPTSAVAGQTTPPEGALTILARHVRHGALTDIEEWAQTLRTNYPEHAQFAREVERLAEELNLTALNDLIAQK